MMEGLIGLLITVVVLALVFYLIYWVVGQIPLPDPFKTVVMVVLGLIAVIVLLGVLFGGISIPVLRMR
jgi:hypothetical protein